MPITCFIRYEIDPFQKDQFTAYAENWARIIPRLGGHLLGYFVPHEGSNYEAWGLISFASLAAYEAYRQRLRDDDETQTNFAFAQRERFILKEERSFPQPVPASYLLAGDYASAGELARAASVSPATASGHLGKLMAAELLVCEQRGRHRYYKLADDEVAHALEAVALIAERRDHMAGKLPKALLAHCLQQGWLRRHDGERALEVTPLGRKHLAGLLPSVNSL